ncbi:MAG: FAD-dependent oxidoreductase [Marinicellaceae bacterium]
MNLKSWGNYPQAQGKHHVADSDQTCYEILQHTQSLEQSLIAQGNGRSYGDSAFSDHLMDMKKCDYFLDFDKENGLLQIQSGALLSDVLEIIIPQGWILAVMPGTQLITIGGAIASDVHGKNHHKIGTFCQFVQSIRLMQNDGKVINCSAAENPETFHNTCAGMGLTGIILDATIQLQKINSNLIKQTTIKSLSLKNTFELFEKYNESSYSVAWIDCLAKGEELGKSVVILGEPESNGNLVYKYKSRLKMPFYLPSFVLNSWSIKIFNWLYFWKAKNGQKSVRLQEYFFPLDGIIDWNKMYGKKGFVQYQCVLPLDNSFIGMKAILEKISASKQGSFLAVLKRMGPENKNLLSFPMEGYSLALDFKVSHKTFKLLDELDEITKQHKGRIYLCKDARMSIETFNDGYPNADKFRQYRVDNGLNKVFNSQQSQRFKL